MEISIRELATFRGLCGAVLFLFSGLFATYSKRARVSLLEMVIEILCVCVLTPAACFWINRKPANPTGGSTASQ
jgi:hypothetical protein